VESIDEIVPNTGAVMREGSRKVAVFRDETGEIHRLSAVCPHLGCIVAWNKAAATPPRCSRPPTGRTPRPRRHPAALRRRLIRASSQEKS
jgi:Rieske Fe-S protein